MENNMFEGAKFGDRFKTRGGRMAIYVKHGDDILTPNLLLVDGDGEVAVSNEGLVWARHPDIEVSNDIVGRWDELNEEVLDRLAEDALKEEIRIAKHSEALGQCYGITFESGFKKGYRKAKE